MNSGYLVPKEIVDALQSGRTSSREVFIPIPGLSGGVPLPDWGGIEGTEVERYNYWVKECLTLYAQYELRMQKVRQHESDWGGTEYSLRLQLSAEEALGQARGIRRMLKDRDEAVLS